MPGTTAHLSRAQVLLQSGRPELAEKELREALTHDPEDAYARALLALCLGQQKRLPEALDEAKSAVGLAPDFPYVHFVLGHVLLDMHRLKEAEAAAKEAIRLDPEDADQFALLSSIYINRSAWTHALKAADAGLSIDSEHLTCANLRAMALTKLGRREEAGATMVSTLSRDPENAISHANQGWTLLEHGRHREAMDHFREALRLEPELNWAKQGIVEALKARNPVYWVLLRYFFWMSRFNSRSQGIMIFGAWFLVRTLRGISDSNPHLTPYIRPILYLYLIFVFLSWTAQPLFNLTLRLHPLGRYVLSKDQVRASSFVGMCLLGAISGALVGWLQHNTSAWIAAGICGFMMIPVAATFNAAGERARKFLGGYTLLLVALGVGGWLGFAYNPDSDSALALLGMWLLGIMAFTWVAAFVRTRH